MNVMKKLIRRLSVSNLRLPTSDFRLVRYAADSISTYRSNRTFEHFVLVLSTGSTVGTNVLSSRYDIDYYFFWSSARCGAQTIMLDGERSSTSRVDAMTTRVHFNPRRTGPARQPWPPSSEIQRRTSCNIQYVTYVL